MYSNSEDSFWKVVLIFAAIVVTIGVTVAAYSSDDKEAKALQRQGFTNIRVGGWSPLSCSDSDLTAKSFKAKNPQGREVEGVICCGVLKGCTVRW